MLVLGSMTWSTAWTSEAPQSSSDEVLQEVIVTGSRIAGNPDAASSNPLTVVSATTLENSNSLDLQSVLAQLP